MNFREILKDDLILHEGYRSKPYVDTVGKITIGVGFNLDDNGLPSKIIEELLDMTMKEAIENAQSFIRNFDDLSDNRKAVLANMAFNLGLNRFRGFKRLRTAVETSQFDLAAMEMLNSHWAKQVGQRATYLADKMKQG